jgi:hypothetical protein
VPDGAGIRGRKWRVLATWRQICTQPATGLVTVVAMSGVVANWLHAAARRTLARLDEQFGAAGLVAAAAMPGLAAAVDQHSAAVRDILAFGVEQSAAVAGAVLLAGYARGLIDEATEQGRRLTAPADAGGWAKADWLSLRLLAVCALAATADDPRGEIGPVRPAT